MVEALVCGLEGGGDKSGYIPGMCSDHSLVASYSGPTFFHLLLVHKTVWCSLSSLSIQIGVLAVTFHITLTFTMNCLVTHLGISSATLLVYNWVQVLDAIHNLTDFAIRPRIPTTAPHPLCL